MPPFPQLCCHPMCVSCLSIPCAAASIQIDNMWEVEGLTCLLPPSHACPSVPATCHFHLPSCQAVACWACFLPTMPLYSACLLDFLVPFFTAACHCACLPVLLQHACFLPLPCPAMPSLPPYHPCPYIPSCPSLLCLLPAYTGSSPIPTPGPFMGPLVYVILYHVPFPSFLTYRLSTTLVLPAVSTTYSLLLLHGTWSGWRSESAGWSGRRRGTGQAGDTHALTHLHASALPPLCHASLPLTYHYLVGHLYLPPA